MVLRSPVLKDFLSILLALDSFTASFYRGQFREHAAWRQGLTNHNGQSESGLAAGVLFTTGEPYAVGEWRQHTSHRHCDQTYITLKPWRIVSDASVAQW